MIHDPTLEITLNEARARGFVVDFPEHPRGVGAPIEGRHPGTSYPQRFDRFFVHRLCPFAGWLKRDDVAGTGTPAFVAGKTRADALAHIRSARGAA